MKEKPILFSGEMVKAILEGRKTQTRRIIKPRYLPVVEECLRVNGKWVFDTFDYDLGAISGRPGDRLWVKETFLNNALDGYPPIYFYRADGNEKPADRHWKPSIFMPRKASRITLEITGVRVERLKDMKAGDAEAEGCDSSTDCRDNLADFKALWESINGEGSWDANPWVWVIEFKPTN